VTATQVEPSQVPEATDLGPWNPGVASRLPSRLLPLSTIFRPENVFTDVARVKELRELTGLDFSELVTFRPERLALHELLIRVTADLSVSDGSRWEDLGINFRAIVTTILERYVQPDMPRIVATYAQCRERLTAVVAQELAAASDPAANSPAAPPVRAMRWLLARRLHKRVPAAPDIDQDLSDLSLADRCESKALSCQDTLQAAALRSLARVTRSLYANVGNWRAASDLVASVAVDLACNDYCGSQIGQLIEAHVLEAVRRDGLRLLPAQDPAIVMNTKGPSASGKSTLRPLQHALADRIGVDWTDFSLVSPDIWRKQLLDYDSLGVDHRYGATLTGEELAIVDRKLDRYVENKAEQGRMPHLLIDRFRFGSFIFQSERTSEKLLSRFGQVIYFFFMITPPDALVERAWKRGLELGRYKAVDDLLAHSVEAYSGMPNLFLAWACRTDKSVHFEFLDNSVPLGHVPRTVAFGWNSQMFVLDVKSMLDVVRYRRVSIDATGPDQLFRDVGPQGLAAQNNADFLLQCVRQMHQVNFADRATGRIYLRIDDGRPMWVDGHALATAVLDGPTRAGIQAVAPGVLDRATSERPEPMHIQNLWAADRIRTLGDWGHEADRVRT
jgi:hypothetical protein